MPQHPHAHIGVPARSQEDETRTQEHAAAAGETVFRTSKSVVTGSAVHLPCAGSQGGDGHRRGGLASQ
jgi:hypothetical protein